MAGHPSTRHLVLHGLAVLSGFALLGWVVWQVGLTDVLHYFRQIGWWAPLLIVPALAIALCDAKGWACALPATVHLPHIPLWRWSLARLAGEAINNLTPTANIGGEPVKVYMLRAHGLTTDAGLASVVVAKTALTVSQVVFVLIGIPFFLYRLGWMEQGWWIFGPLIALAYGFVMLLIRWQRRGLMGMAVRALSRVLPRWQRLTHWEERAQRIDAHLLSVYEGDSRRFVASTVYHFGGWLLNAVELALFLYFMGVDAPILDALIIETMIQPVSAAGLIIPGAVGVQEAGGVYLCRLLGLDDGAGLTLMALRRGREMLFNLVGLTALAHVSGTFLPRKIHSV